MATPVVLVAGLHATARTATVDRLLARHPGSLAVHHDLGEATRGRVRRGVRDSRGVLDTADVRLTHGCVTCAVREDLLPQLVRLAPGAPLLIVDLWDSVEPRSVAEAVDCAEARQTLRLTAVLTAVDAAAMPDDLTRGERLAEIGKPAAGGDQRYLADVLARQLEYPTGLVLHGGDEDDRELSRRVLAHLAPVTPLHTTGSLPPVTGAAVCTAELAARVDPATAQLPCDARTDEIVTTVWRSRRPLHPARLFEAVDELVTESVRSRGRFWLATRPGQLLAWDAVAGLVSAEDAGPWLAALPEAAWDLVSPARRLTASLDWAGPYGDRVQHLVFTGPDLDPARFHALLDSCLLTAEEEAAGPDVWAGYDDPFAPLLNVKENV
ncbi:CobW family GTP-binding protein [Nonomuraea gerenzanensis]|uniref:Putative metal chaperone, involved in Zn homeostasis, GTPase of COG0523 family n=1 Tax=Nonomuraea gerenzanensis TaxID=93944 RepID=A0A1M4E9Y0_9ACTN|nr:GTP-binding protein [Nonomuraea gerenzanensis]UBU17866.1 GTP-binding protein [Nonomuraea gerenzanensis]SBO95656.1 Putative metal chaperone, involved in Zn homeostasis, GTPase of COG0523 family [Nonomuraea gerenzanensis]